MEFSPHKSFNHYGKFGEAFYLDEDKLNRAIQLLWDYLYLHLKKKKFRHFHWQDVHLRRERMSSRALSVRRVHVASRDSVRVVYNVRLPKVCS